MFQIGYREKPRITHIDQEFLDDRADARGGRTAGEIKKIFDFFGSMNNEQAQDIADRLNELRAARQRARAKNIQ